MFGHTALRSMRGRLLNNQMGFANSLLYKRENPFEMVLKAKNDQCTMLIILPKLLLLLTIALTKQPQLK